MSGDVVTSEVVVMPDGEWSISIDKDGVCVICDPEGGLAHKSGSHESTAVHLAMQLSRIRRMTTTEGNPMKGWL